MKSLFATTAVAAVLAFALPASAQQDYYNTNPTPQERAQTDQLNGQAADRAHRDADEATAPPTPLPPPDDPGYRAAKAAADRDNADYRAERAAYDRDHESYDRRWEMFANADALRDIRFMPDDRLIGRRVLGRDEARIGRIRQVDRNDRGGVSRVLIATRDGRTAWIDPRDLRYDPVARTVYTELSRGQVDQMTHERFSRRDD